MKAIQSARRRGRLGTWQRRFTILLLTAAAVGVSYVFSIGRPPNYQALLAGVVGFVGLCALVLDWWISRGIKRSGGVQAMRSGGVLSTGPAAMAGRLWAQGEGFRICGLPDDARKNFGEAASLAREAKQELLEATVRLSQGDLAAERGEFDDAARLYEDALNRFRAGNDNRSAGRAVMAIGNLALTRRGYEAARQAFEEARGLFGRESDRFGEGSAYLGLGEACVRLSKTEEAAGNFDQARFMLTQVGDRIGEAHALYGRGEMYRLERNAAEAQNRFERALTLYRRTGDWTPLFTVAAIADGCVPPSLG